MESVETLETLENEETVETAETVETVKLWRLFRLKIRKSMTYSVTTSKQEMLAHLKKYRLPPLFYNIPN